MVAVRKVGMVVWDLWAALSGMRVDDQTVSGLWPFELGWDI